jgi:hypothetical protein
MTQVTNCGQLLSHAHVLDDYLPLLFYACTIVVFWRLAHVQASFWLWKVAWGLMTFAAICLAIGRITVNLQVLHGVAWDGWIIVVRTVLVLLASASLLAGALAIWRVYRLGQESS